MEAKEPMVSICIPTYNRSYLLDDTIKSIVQQKIFQETNDVELVISNNASTDQTDDVVRKYKNEYPGKIVYLKHETGIHPHDNFMRAMEAGNGKYLKLNNDYLTYHDGALEKLVAVIRDNIDKPAQLFILPASKNDESGSLRSKECNTLNDFIQEVSFMNTWIVAFGIWKKDYEQYKPVLVSKKETMLNQSYTLFEMCVRSSVKVYYFDGYKFLKVQNKGGGYNNVEIFGKGYVGFLKEFLERGELSKELFEKEKHDVLIKSVNVGYFDLRNEFRFQRTGYFKWLLPDYKSHWYFWKWWMFFSVAKIIYRIGMFLFGSKWDHVESAVKKLIW